MPNSHHSPEALAALSLPIAFAGGSLTFLVFLVIAFAGIVIGYYTRKGSGIDPHPYGKIYSGAPGAGRSPNVSGRDERREDVWRNTRGTR